MLSLLFPKQAATVLRASVPTAHWGTAPVAAAVATFVATAAPIVQEAAQHDEPLALAVEIEQAAERAKAKAEAAQARGAETESLVPLYLQLAKSRLETARSLAFRSATMYISR